MSKFGEVSSAKVLTAQMRLSVTNFRKGGTAPSDSTLGTTPTVPTLLFTATNQLLSGSVPIPRDMDRSVNPQLTLQFALDVAESDSDTLDFTGDYIVTEHLAGDGGLVKASTQLTGSVTVTTAGGLVQGEVYELALTLNVGDATNPIGADSDDISFEVHLTNTTGVGRAHLFAGRFDYERSH